MLWLLFAIVFLLWTTSSEVSALSSELRSISSTLSSIENELNSIASDVSSIESDISLKIHEHVMCYEEEDL